MINANELRIGNWYNDNGIYKQVTPNIIEQLFESTERLWINPIPLTPEILEKCGAEKFPTGKRDYSLHGVLLSYADCRSVYTHNGKELLYLHTLQNYIFALTNQELICDSTK